MASYIARMGRGNTLRRPRRLVEMKRLFGIISSNVQTVHIGSGAHRNEKRKPVSFVIPSVFTIFALISILYDYDNLRTQRGTLPPARRNFH
jgi:formyltetrahydrofolate synthetase